MVDLERHLKRFEEEYPRELSSDFFQSKFGHLPISVCEDWMAKMERLHEIITSGCPVRSLESAFEVEATESEYDLYLNSFNELRRQAAPLRPLLHNDFQRPLLESYLYKQSMLFFARFLQTVAVNASALGERLRGHSCQMVAVGYDDVTLLLQEEKKVLLRFKRSDGSHVAHVGLKEGEIVCLSDYEFPAVDITKDTLYQAVIFNQKKNHPAEV